MAKNTDILHTHTHTHGLIVNGKDWIGNKKTTFVQLGASNHTNKKKRTK